MSQVRIPLKAIITKITSNFLPKEYDIDPSESEMTCHYSNSRAPGEHILSTAIAFTLPWTAVEVEILVATSPSFN